MKILKILLVLCSLLVAVASYADDDDDHEKKRYKHNKSHFYKNLDFLDLNHQQYKKIRNILVIYKKDYKKFYKYKHKQKKELRNIMQEDVFDKDNYVKIDSEIKVRASRLEARKFNNIHAVLNKEQRKKFSYHLEEWEVE